MNTWSAWAATAARALTSTRAPILAHCRHDTFTFAALRFPCESHRASVPLGEKPWKASSLHRLHARRRTSSHIAALKRDSTYWSHVCPFVPLLSKPNEAHDPWRFTPWKENRGSSRASVMLKRPSSCWFLLELLHSWEYPQFSSS